MILSKYHRMIFCLRLKFVSVNFQAWERCTSFQFFETKPTQTLVYIPEEVFRFQMCFNSGCERQPGLSDAPVFSKGSLNTYIKSFSSCLFSGILKSSFYWVFDLGGIQFLTFTGSCCLISGSWESSCFFYSNSIS